MRAIQRRKQSTRRSIVWGIGVLLVAGLLISSVVHFLPPNKNLLERAIRIASTHGWYLFRQEPGKPKYQWLSNTSVLIFRDVPMAPSKNEFIHRGNQTSPAIVALGGGNALCYNLLTHQERPLIAFNRWFNETKGSPDTVRVSPDGKRVFWQQLSDTFSIDPTFPVTAFSTTLQGTEFHRWQHVGYVSPSWLGESQGCLEFRWDKAGQKIDALLIRDLQASNKIRVLPVAGSNPLNQAHVNVLFAAVTPFNHLLVDTSDYVINLGHQGKSLPDCKILELMLDKQVSQLHQFSIHLPQGSVLEYPIYSPMADQIAWVLDVPRVPLLATCLHRLYPPYKVQTQTVWSLWVSHIDGSDMHEVGEMPATAQQCPAALQWLPDGKRISFCYYDTLWSVPVD